MASNQSVSNDNDIKTKRPGMALCLSGGGYRALLFHLGAIRRLNELGLLSKLERIASVSGGSILAGLLGLEWKNFRIDDEGIITNFDDLITSQIIGLTSKTIDLPTAILGFLTFRGPGSQLVRTYSKHLFKDATLQQFPDKPRIVICSTNLRSGVYCRFSKPYIWDYRIGQIKSPNVSIALAVAASSAFPPILSPVKFNTSDQKFEINSGYDLENKRHHKKLILTDGGVYDNLGLEAIKNFETILISDGSKYFSTFNRDLFVSVRQIFRSLEIIQSQVRKLRLRRVIELYKNGDLKGVYWGVSSNIKKTGIVNFSAKYVDFSHKLGDISTRLKRIDCETRNNLINLGYEICKIRVKEHLI